MPHSKVFIAVAVIEAATGVALMIAPAVVMALLVGANVETAADMVVARVAAIAMVSIAIACWIARNDRSEAARGLLIAVLVYNGAVALLLIHAAVYGNLSAIGLWPAVVVHAALAAWCVISRSR